MPLHGLLLLLFCIRELSLILRCRSSRLRRRLLECFVLNGLLYLGSILAFDFVILPALTMLFKSSHWHYSVSTAYYVRFIKEFTISFSGFILYVLSVLFSALDYIQTLRMLLRKSFLVKRAQDQSQSLFSLRWLQRDIDGSYYCLSLFSLQSVTGFLILDLYSHLFNMPGSHRFTVLNSRGISWDTHLKSG
jgi:hypothetical protein